MNNLTYLFLLIAILLGRPPAWSQTFSAQKLPLPSDKTSEYTPFRIDLPGLYQYLAKTSEEEPIPLELIMENQPVKLEIWRSELRHPAYELITAGEVKEKRPAIPTLFLLGRTAGQPATDVALAVHENFLLGQIGDLIVEPAAPHFQTALPASALISYPANEGGTAPAAFCGMTEGAKEQAHDLLETARTKDLRAGECYTVELAIAADYLALLQFGNVYTLENYYLGILNMVRLVYDDEFADAIRFAVRGFYVSTCPDCDPWTASTSANDLLASLRDWGNGGGFGFYYDLASMWTGRVFDDNLAGLGSLSAVCESKRYHVLRNYTDKTGLLRTLQAHELGHNFSARHDPEDAPYIMAPIIADIDVWSEESRAQMERYLNLLVAQKEWCLSGCTAPQANFLAPAITGCAPLRIQFADNSKGEVTAWQWFFEGGSPAEDTLPNPVVTYTQPGVFGARLRVLNASGESEHVEEAFVTVLPPAVSTFTSNVNTATRTVQFQFNGSGAEYYFWTFGDGAESRAPNPTHTYAAGGTYDVRLIVENNCGADTSRQTISFLAPPAAAFTPVQTTGCAPLTVQFADRSTGEIAERQWFFENGSPATSTEANPTVRFEQPGAHRVRLLVRNEGGESESVIEEAVLVEGPPRAAFTAAADQQARRVQFQFNGDGARDFFWQFGDGATSREANPTHTYAAAGEYPVQLNVENDCGADTYRQTISFIAPPAAAFSATPTQICTSESITFSDNSQGIVNSRQWSFPGGQPSTSTMAAPTIRYDRPGRYSVRLEISNEAGGDVLVKEDYIHVLGRPQAAFEVDGALGDTVFVFLNNSLDAVRYDWRFGDGGRSSEANPTYYYRQDGHFPVQLISENACGRDTAEQMVQVLRPPAADFGVLSEMGCAPRVVQFEDRSNGSVSERLWSFPGGDPASSTAPNPIVTYARTGVFDVQLTVRNAAGERTVRRAGAVIVPEAPLARFSYNYTLGDSLVLFTNESERADAYVWDFGDGQQSTENNPAHIYRRDGDYTVRLQAHNDCRTSLMIAQITVITLPRASFRADPVTGCAPLTIEFESTSSENTQSLVWQFPGGRPTLAYEERPVVTYPYPGQYTVRLKARNAAGETVEEKQQWIIVSSEPRVGFEFEQAGPMVRFFNNSEKADAYQWDFGDGRTSTEASPSHEYQAEGMYPVQLIGTNDCGADTTTQTLSVIINSTGEPDWRSTVRVFPNPNPGRFAVAFGSLPGPQARLRLWNNLGQLIGAVDWNNQLSPIQWIDIPNARPGLYLLEVDTGVERGYWRVLLVDKGS